MAEQIVSLNPGESQVVSFEAVPHEARRYHVLVDSLSGSFIADGVRVHDFVIEPTEVRVGEPIHISFNVTNTTEARSGLDCYCKVNKMELEPQSTGWLYLGDGARIVWEFIPSEAKSYSVVIDVRELGIPVKPRVQVFEGMFTALPTVGEPEPLTISIPSTIVGGEGVLTSHTIYLPYILNCRYSIFLALVGTGLNWRIELVVAEARYVDERWMLPEYFPRAYVINADGEFTFTGIPQADYDRETDTHGPVYQIPAKTTYWKDHLLELPLPKGIYKVVSLGHLRLIEYADKDHASYYDERRLWTDMVMGEVEIV